jgi:hypothetical protein
MDCPRLNKMRWKQFQPPVLCITNHSCSGHFRLSTGRALVTVDCFKLYLTPAVQLQPPRTIVFQNNHFAILRICKHVELIYGVSEITSKKDSDANAMGDKDVVLCLLSFKASPE